MKMGFLLCLLGLAVVAGCGEHTTVTATIRVTAPTVKGSTGDSRFTVLQQEMLTSSLFLQHVNETFHLARVWNKSDTATIDRLRGAIRVEPFPGGNSKFTVQMRGIEHNLAVQIVNELCDFYVAQTQPQLATSRTGKLQVTIISRAE